jgi:hypothetical protein
VLRSAGAGDGSDKAEEDGEDASELDDVEGPGKLQKLCRERCWLVW